MSVRLNVVNTVLDFLPSNNYGTGCPITYRLITTDGIVYAKETLSHRIWQLGEGTLEWSPWWYVDTGVEIQSVEVETGCNWVHDTLLANYVTLLCWVDGTLLDTEIVEQWGDKYDWEGYCLSIDPDDIQGWEDVAYDPACPSKYSFNSDGTATFL